MNPSPSATKRGFGTARTSADLITSRECAIRDSLKKWYGPLEMLDPKGRARERAQQESVLQTLLSLHRLGVNVSADNLHVSVPQQDVFSAITILNRLGIMIKCPTTAIISYCEARMARENTPRFNRVDPLQLRHLLSFHQDIPHEELNAFDILTLKVACEKNDEAGLRTWFTRMGKKKDLLPKDTPQFLRAFAMDLWNSGQRDFIKIYATELAVFDTAMCEGIGWENTRLFLAVLNRLHGSVCHATAMFLDMEDIDTAIELHESLGDAEQAKYFNTLADTHSMETLRRLRLTIASVSKNTETRTPFGLSTSNAQGTAAPQTSSPFTAAAFGQEDFGTPSL